jgi:hypothetical protein
VFDVVMPELVEDADPNQLTLLGGVSRPLP